MNLDLLTLYKILPPSLRSIAASVRGMYLRAWRYGSETQRLVEEALDRESWSTEKLTAWQEERLAHTLHRAAQTVPYYSEQWARRRAQGDRASWEYLENWPILTKDSVRCNPSAFVSKDCNIRKMFHEHTSGTTGTPLNLWWSRDTVRAWYALFEARCRRWHGVDRGNRWAILGGQLVIPVEQRQPPFWVWNAALNQLYMSSYHLSPEYIPYYFDALKRYRIQYLYGYTSSLNALAQEGARRGRTDLDMLVAITNAEPVYPSQRKSISHIFQCPVSETYGMAELVAAASECKEGHLHLWPEVGWIEIMNENKVIRDGLSGDLICTGLLNIDMPLIRYHVGDRAVLERAHALCACGRSLSMMASVEGRVDDTLYTRDGKKVGRLDPVFKGDLPIKEAQIVQETLGRIRVYYVPTNDFTLQSRHSLINRIRERMGDVDVILKEVSQVPQEQNGKIRSVICNLSEKELSECVRQKEC
ncbi:MAG: capsular polysaccharide biosynthesis protein CapK [Nitrospirales bacterium]|nr:MAG: capsular polysaccharide biosynthesis protein CapK [Nitrospirales bacterium]